MISLLITSLDSLQQLILHFIHYCNDFDIHNSNHYIHYNSYYIITTLHAQQQLIFNYIYYYNDIDIYNNSCYI